MEAPLDQPATPAEAAAFSPRARRVAVLPPGGGMPSLRGPESAAAPRARAESRPEPRPEELHPALWRAHQLGRGTAAVQASGYAALDAELPGAGWPAQALTELLLPHPGVGELRLLAPALAALQAAGRCVMWFNPPAEPCAWVLRALGLDLRRLLLVLPPPRPAGADLLWALEQALHSGQLGAVLAWLPTRLPPDALRRLQLAAQAHPGPAFLLREGLPGAGWADPAGSRTAKTVKAAAAAALPASPAPLRLQLAAAGPDTLALRFLKRRGPPRVQPLLLALPPVLSEPLRERAAAARQAGLTAQPAAGALQALGSDSGAAWRFAWAPTSHPSPA